MEKIKPKRVVKENVTTTVDVNTGEFLEVRDLKEFRVDGEPDYVKLYLGDVSRIFGLTTGVSTLMYILLRYMTYENIVALTPYIRKSIADELKTTVDVINHALSKLITEGIFTKLGTGTYMANPDIFGKGKWADIKNLRLSITYDQNGRTFKASRNDPEQLEIELAPGEKGVGGLDW